MLDCASVTILSRYVVARFLALFFATLLATVTAVAGAEVLLHVESIFKGGDPIGELLRYLGQKIPAVYLRTLIPVAAFSGAFASIGLAARWHELTAVKAAGISPLRIAAPVLAMAGVLTLASFALYETLVIGATRAWESRENGSRRGEIAFRSGSFWFESGNVIYNVRHADPDSRTWRGLRMFELSERGLPIRIIHARRVQLRDADWLLSGVTIRGFDPAQPLAPPTLEHLDEVVRDIGEDAEHALRHLDAAHLALPQLWEYIASRSAEGEDDTRARGFLHARLADPLTTLLFAVLAIPLGVRVEEAKSMAVPAALGVGLIALFLFARTLGAVLIREDLVPPGAVPWLTLVGFGAFGTWRFARIPR